MLVWGLSSGKVRVALWEWLGIMGQQAGVRMATTPEASVLSCHPTGGGGPGTLRVDTRLCRGSQPGFLDFLLIQLLCATQMAPGESSPELLGLE